MNGDPVPQSRPEPWRLVARGVLSVVIVAGLGVWLLFSFVLAVLRCDDTCSGTNPDHWRWTGQLLLAGMASALGLLAMLLGFSRSLRRPYRVLVALSALTAWTWLVWVFESGRF